jgi:hypothetical protein
VLKAKAFNLKVEVHDSPKYWYPSTRPHGVNPEGQNTEFFQRFENLNGIQPVRLQPPIHKPISKITETV